MIVQSMELKKAKHGGRNVDLLVSISLTTCGWPQLANWHRDSIAMIRTQKIQSDPKNAKRIRKIR
jgi:hypothetical protein